MKARERQMIASNSLAILRDGELLTHLFPYSLPITGTLLRKGFSMFMDFLRLRLTVESEESLILYWFLTQT